MSKRKSKMKKRRKERKLMRYELTHRSEKLKDEKEDPIKKEEGGSAKRILVV